MLSHNTIARYYSRLREMLVVCNIIKIEGLNRKAKLDGKIYTKPANRPIRPNEFVQKKRVVAPGADDVSAQR